ncbi:MAG: hypothetical protein WCO04_03815 [Pseudomonadota bacterium]
MRQGSNGAAMGLGEVFVLFCAGLMAGIIGVPLLVWRSARHIPQRGAVREV